MSLPNRSKSILRAGPNGITGVCTRPRRRAVIGFALGFSSTLAVSPAVRLAVEDAELLELAADIGLALLGGGGQRRPGWADIAAHHPHAALERERILIAKQQP